LGLGVDSDLAICTKDFGAVFLAGGHHTGAVELRDLASLSIGKYELGSGFYKAG
jgi:hypothetical protein